MLLCVVCACQSNHAPPARAARADAATSLAGGQVGPPAHAVSVASVREQQWYERVDDFTDADPDVRRERREAGEADFAFACKFPRPLSRGHALEILLKTDRFTGTAVGFAATTPPQCYAFKTILSQTDAAGAFASLVRRGQPAGQLFGLCGLHLKDRAAFDEAFPRYRENHQIVSVMLGCIIDGWPMSKVAAGIATGQWPRAFANVKGP